MPTLRATDYLKQPEKTAPAPVCAVFGSEAFLKRVALERLRDAVLQGEDSEFSRRTFNGATAELHQVLDEIATVALFGGGRRLAIVEDADPFVTRNRAKLEDYVQRPNRRGVLILDVSTWAANTRLYKLVNEHGLQIDCKSPTPAELTAWLKRWARDEHKLTIEPDAIELMIEIIGPELGRLDQELSKLSAAVGDKPVSADMVQQLAGGWQAKSVWDLLDTALAGDAVGAIKQLDRLLSSGEQPLGVLGPISTSLRRMGLATRAIVQAEKKGRRLSPRDALAEVGVPAFLLSRAEPQLRQLGRARAGSLSRWLLEADRGMKGGSQLPPRFVIERLICRMSRAAMPKSA